MSINPSTQSGVWSAFSSIMGAVSVTANGASQVINAAAGSAVMLDAFVKKAAEEQAIRYAGERASYLDRIEREYVQADAESELKTLEFCQKSDAHRSLYEASLTKYSKVFKRFRSESETSA